MHLGFDVLKTFLHILSVTPTHMRSKDTEPEPSLNGRSLPKINCENQYIEFDDDFKLKDAIFCYFLHYLLKPGSRSRQNGSGPQY